MRCFAMILSVCVAGPAPLLEPHGSNNSNPWSSAHPAARFCGADQGTHSRTDRLAHGAGHRGILLDPEADLELHRGKPFAGVPSRLLGEVPERIARLAPVEPGRVGADL